LNSEELYPLNKSINFFKFIRYSIYGVLYSFIFCNFSQAKDAIEITAGYSKPPFVIESTQQDEQNNIIQGNITQGNIKQDKGIQLDLVSAIFAVEQQPVDFVHMSLARSFSSVDKWLSDGIITLPRDHEIQGAYVSEPYIQYHNVVVTLTEDQLSINDLSDLSDKNIIAFQTAKQFLGADFSNAVEHSNEYIEMPDQTRQIKMLFLKRTQALVLDINIFKYFIHNHSEDKYQKAYKIHYLFAPKTYSAAFRSIAMRDQFNRGLKTIKANGKYQQILDKYLF